MTNFVDPSPSAGLPGEAHTSQLNDLGAVRTYSDGSVYIYLSGVASCIAGSVVVYNLATFAPTLIVTGLKGPVAVATAAVTAAKFGWFMIVGAAASTVRTAVTTNVALFAGGVAGFVDVAAVKGDQVRSMYARTPGGANGGTTTLHVNRAFIGASNETTG